MKEKDRKTEERNNHINTKLTWETPRLYALDKGKTESGTTLHRINEDDIYTTIS